MSTSVTLPIPLGGNRQATLTLPRQLSAEEYDSLRNCLDIWLTHAQPALVELPPTTRGDDDGRDDAMAAD